MKKQIFAVILILAAVVCASANEPYFLVRKGASLLYAMQDGSGRTTGYMRNSVSNVTGSPANMTVTYVTQSFDAQMGLLVETPPVSVRIVNGAVEMDMSGAFSDIMASMPTSGLDMRITGDTKISIPANIAVGDRLRDQRMTLTMDSEIMKISMDIAITNQRCVSAERITVPAGAFDSVKLTQTATTTMNGQNMMSGTSEVWYARGIGNVKTVTRTTTSGAENVMVMVLQSAER